MVDHGDVDQSSDKEERDSMTMVMVMVERGLGLRCWRWSFFIGGGVGREVAGIAKLLFSGGWGKEVTEIVFFSLVVGFLFPRG